jgi:hypothetical protein
VGSSYQQTDEISDCPFDDYCSGAGLGGTVATRKAIFGGSAGSASIQLGANLTNKALLNFEIAPNVSGLWPAGNWTIRLNVVAANANITWTRVYICRVSAACGGLSTIGSSSTLGILCNTTGVKTAVISGAAVAAAAASDKIIVVLVFQKSGGSGDFYISPSVLIDTPINQGGMLSAAGAGAAAFVGRRSWRGAFSSAGVGTPTRHGKSTKRVVLSTAGGSALSAIGRLLRRGVFSSAGTVGTSLIGTSNRPVLRIMGMGTFSPLIRTTGQMILGAVGLGAFLPATRATVPTRLTVDGAGATSLIGAATTTAGFEIDGTSSAEFELTWLGWAQEGVEAPPNAGWVMEDML